MDRWSAHLRKSVSGEVGVRGAKFNRFPFCRKSTSPTGPGSPPTILVGFDAVKRLGYSRADKFGRTKNERKAPGARWRPHSL